jgi:hypothetical protein
MAMRQVNNPDVLFFVFMELRRFLNLVLLPNDADRASLCSPHALLRPLVI